MTCPSCGNINNEGSKFCIKCGTPLAVAGASVPQNTSSSGVQQSVQQNTAHQVASQNKKINKEKVTNIIKLMIKMITKPTETIEEESENLKSTKNALIISGIISGLMMLITLLSTIINAVFVKDYFSGKLQVTFSNLKYIKFLNVIFKNFFVYLLLIFAIGGIYYLGSLIIKKNINFFKTISIASFSLVPMIGCSMILSPILGRIWSVFGFIFSVVGIIYSIVLIYELMNHEIKLEGNIKIYFNAAIISILLISIYYISIYALTTSIMTNLIGL